MLKKTQIFVEGLSAYRAVDKLVRAGICVCGARKTQKNGVIVEVNSKDVKKVFAILRSSCYNVKKVRYRGFARWKRSALRRVGLLAGAALFLLAVAGAQSRVLRVDVVGSGAYYRDEVLGILSENGVGTLSLPPDGDLLCAQILSLPRVSFCSFRHSGGILTVEVEVSDEAAPLSGEPLYAPVSGTLEELVIVRGEARAAEGDEVEAGQLLVDNAVTRGEEQFVVLVIACARISRPFSAVYRAEGEEEALAQAMLETQELRDIQIRKTQEGWLVEGTELVSAQVNFG